MHAFKTFIGLVMPLDRSNVDTDAIIPKQYLKSIKRTGFGINLFDDWRYLEPGNPGDDHSKRKINPDFILNDPAYSNAEILLVRKNFGCGSSREHAVWALMDHGFKVVIAPSFADIFYSNCFKNGLLPITLDEEIIDILFTEALGNKGCKLEINLEKQMVNDESGNSWEFEIDAGYKERLLKGLDEIGVTLTHADTIRAYEEKRRAEAPWLFPDNQ